MPIEGSSEQRSEGKAGRLEQTRTWVGLGFEGDTGGTIHVHESSRGMDKSLIELSKKSSRGS